VFLLYHILFCAALCVSNNNNNNDNDDEVCLQRRVMQWIAWQLIKTWGVESRMSLRLHTLNPMSPDSTTLSFLTTSPLVSVSFNAFHCIVWKWSFLKCFDTFCLATRNCIQSVIKTCCSNPKAKGFLWGLSEWTKDKFCYEAEIRH